MNIEVHKVPLIERALIAKLMQLYQYDFTDFGGQYLNAQANFEYEYLDSYWIEPDRHPFLITTNGKIAGLCLVNRHSRLGNQDVHCVAEFFILRYFRRQGMGALAAQKILQQFPGKWEIVQTKQNKTSQVFWHKLVQSLVNENFERHEIENGEKLCSHLSTLDMKTSLLPEFKTKRLILKAITAVDIPAYEKYFIDYAVIEHLASVVPWPYPPGGVKFYLENEIFPNQGIDRWTWGLFLQINPDELIGAIDLWRQGKPEHRGFWLGKKFWNQGYMTEAVAPITDYAFNHLGFEQLIFSNAVGNQRSRRIKEKTGAKFIGIQPGKFVNPAYGHKEIWELNKSLTNPDSDRHVYGPLNWYSFNSADRVILP